MAELFDKDLKTINEHIINIYNERELEDCSTIRKFRIVQQEGYRSVSRNIDQILFHLYQTKTQKEDKNNNISKEIKQIKNYIISFKF